MTTVGGRTFRGLTDREGDCRVNGTEFRRCTFNDCLVSSEDAQRRPVVRNSRFIDCEEHSCSVSNLVIEDVTVEGLRVRDLLIVADCAFRHVTLRGELGSLKITPGFAALVKNRPKLQAALDQANLAYYTDVDWALDISAAEFEDFDVDGVPLSLIRRDEETQVILPASVAVGGEWRRVPEFAKVWGPRVDALLKVGLGPELLLVAAKRHGEFRADLGGITALKKSGLIQ